MGDVYAQLEQLTKEATKLSDSGHTQEALDKFQNALQLAKECQSESDAFATCLFNAGVCMITLEKYDKALSTLKEAVTLWPNALECEAKDEDKIRMFADAHSHMATCCYALGRASEAMPLLRQALRGYESLQPSSKKDIAMMCWQLSCRLEEQSRYSEALDFLQRVIECARDLEDHRLLATAYRQKTLILARNKERAVDVSEFLELAQVACDAIEDMSVRSATCSSIGDAFVTLNMSEKAEACFSKALATLRTNPDLSYQSEEASLLQNIGAARNLMETYEESIQYHKEAIDLYGSLEQRQNQVHCMLNLGFAHTKLKQYHEAADILAKAVDVSATCQDKEMEIAVLENLGTAQYCDGRFEAAVESFQKALCALGCISKLKSGARTRELSERIVGKLSDAISMREEQKTMQIIKQNITSSSSHSNQIGSENVTAEVKPTSSKSIANAQVRKRRSPSRTTSTADANYDDDSDSDALSSSSSREASESEDERLMSKQSQSSLSRALSGGPTVGTKHKLDQRLKQFESPLVRQETPTMPLSHSTPILKGEKLERQPAVRRSQQQHVVREGCLATGDNLRRVGGGAGQNQAAQLETVKEDDGSINTNTTVDARTSSVCVLL